LSAPYLLTITHDGQADTYIVYHCTAIIGVPLFVNRQTTQEDMFKWADRAMYRAKEAGRNAIRFHELKD